MGRISIFRRRKIVKLLAIFVTLMYLSSIFVLFKTEKSANGIQDKEVLLGQFLYSEFSGNASVFDFEAFRDYLVSINNPEFQVKLHPDKYQLKDISIQKYFQQIDDQTSCFIDGTNLPLSRIEKKCSCQMYNSTTPKYFGKDCGIPMQVWQSSGKDEDARMKREWRRRAKPRHIIYAIPLNHEFDLFETCLTMNYDPVDVFIVSESNRTNSGGVKDPHFLFRFATGWMKNYQNKLVYIFQGEFPKDGYEDGWLAEAYMRTHLSRSGLKRLKGVKQDDLFLYTDGDELVRPEILTFLKLYDGYSQPLAFKYKWSTFGFYWTIQEEHFGHLKVPEPSGMTIKFFKDFYHLDAAFIRTREFIKNKNMMKVYAAMNESVGLFEIYDAGWHCSWCFSPEGVRKKLLDAPKFDYPRYGDDIGKTDVDYIKRLIKHGLYFDLSEFRKGGKELTLEEDPDIAPVHVIENRNRMGYLLKNPYKNVNITRVRYIDGKPTK